MREHTMLKQCMTMVIALVLGGIASVPAWAAGGVALSLEEAQRIALAADPAVDAAQKSSQALREQATADGQLPDPRLKFALMNFPTDTFDRTQEPMTQVQMGLIQAFPRGDSLAIRSRRTAAMADGELAKMQEQRRRVQREVRRNWLDVYFWLRARDVVQQSQELFRQLVSITESQYAAGRHNQQDVIRAQLELSLLEDRETKIRTEEAAARAELGKWVGSTAAQRPLPAALPELDPVTIRAELEQRLAQHPQMRMAEAHVDARRQEIALAREAYKPEWMLDVTYGVRGGQNPDDNDRPDFLSAMVVLDLPLFTEKRQDRRLAASQENAGAAMLDKDDKYRELLGRLQSLYASWQRLGERVDHYRQTLLPQAQQNAESTLHAYQNDRTDFTTLVRARITELDTRLQALKLRVDRAKAQAQLLYLAGEEQ